MKPTKQNRMNYSGREGPAQKNRAAQQCMPQRADLPDQALRAGRGSSTRSRASPCLPRRGFSFTVRAERFGKLFLQAPRIAVELARMLRARAFGAAVAPWTRRSVSRTDSPFAATWCASSTWRGRESESSARAWPMSSAPSCTIACTAGASSSRRSRFVTPARERPMARATSSCVSLNSSMRRFRPRRFLDGVQVLALDVLDEADAERGLVGHFAHHRGDALEARDARGAPAALAGEDLVLRVAHGPHHDGLDHAARADRFGELGERGLVHARARLVLAGPQRIDRQLRAARASRCGLRRRRPAARPGRGPVPCACSCRLRDLDAVAAAAARARTAGARCAPFDAGSCSSTGLPNDGASAMRMLRGITVSKTLSP